MRKGGRISIRKWKMIHRVQFIRTHVKIGLVMALELRDIPVLEGKNS